MATACTCAASRAAASCCAPAEPHLANTGPTARCSRGVAAALLHHRPRGATEPADCAVCADRHAVRAQDCAHCGRCAWACVLGAACEAEPGWACISLAVSCGHGPQRVPRLPSAASCNSGVLHACTASSGSLAVFGSGCAAPACMLRFRPWEEPAPPLPHTRSLGSLAALPSLHAAAAAHTAGRRSRRRRGRQRRGRALGQPPGRHRPAAAAGAGLPCAAAGGCLVAARLLLPGAW